MSSFVAHLFEDDGEELPSELNLKFHDRPTDEIETITISRSVILKELLKSLGGSSPTYNARVRNKMYYGCVKAEVPRRRGSVGMVELIGCSHEYFGTEIEAIEKAAEILICSLKKKFKFEVDDINWVMRDQYNKDRFILYDKVENLREKVVYLQDVAKSLRDGWAYTLQLADSVQIMAAAICSSAYYGFSRFGFRGSANQVMANTQKLKECAELTCYEGSYNLNKVLSA